MSHPTRFYVSEIRGDRAVLDKSQSRHLVKALRLKTGDKVELFDKQGNTYQAEITSSGKSVHLKIVNQFRNPQGVYPAHGGTIRNRITLATAIPKGPRMDWLVEKCAELGLSKLIPIQTRFSVTKEVGSNKIARWKRIALSAAQQSRQPTIMEITEILPLPRLFDNISEYKIKFLAMPAGEPIGKLDISNTPILYLIGPEGGFSTDEIKQAKEAGFRTVNLPVGGILRVETAAVTMLGILKYAISEMKN